VAKFIKSIEEYKVKVLEMIEKMERITKNALTLVKKTSNNIVPNWS